MAFNLTCASVKQDDKITINFETVENHLNTFFTNFQDTLQRFENEMVFFFYLTISIIYLLIYSLVV